jgi:mannose-6-phosphate isomerase-like protein (cupin superfamily)
MQMLNKINWESLKHEYDLDAKRLLPYPGINPPFGGAWCVVKSKTKSLAHDEYELFIGISGKANIKLGDEIVEMEKGDIVVIPPRVRHYISNQEQEDFHLYSIWWHENQEI